MIVNSCLVRGSLPPVEPNSRFCRRPHSSLSAADTRPVSLPLHQKIEVAALIGLRDRIDGEAPVAALRLGGRGPLRLTLGQFGIIDLQVQTAALDVEADRVGGLDQLRSPKRWGLGIRQPLSLMYLHAGFPHDGAPVLKLGADEISKLGRCAPGGHGAKFRECFLDARFGERFVNRLLNWLIIWSGVSLRIM